MPVYDGFTTPNTYRDRGYWDYTASYAIGDLVSYIGEPFVALITHTASGLAFDPSQWAPLVGGSAGANTFSGANQFKSFVTFGNPGGIADSRRPFRSSQIMLASAAGANHVAHSMDAIFAGDWSADGGTDPGFGWGINVFCTTDTAAGAANGMNTLYGGLIEAAIRAPAGTTISTVFGTMIDCSFANASAGATVGTMTTLFVNSPRRKDGAVAGTVTGTATGLYCKTVSAVDTGAALAYTTFFQGGNHLHNGSTVIQGDDVTQIPLIVRNTPASASSGFQVQNSASTVLLNVTSTGVVTAPSTISALNGTSNQSALAAFNDGSNHASLSLGSPSDTFIFRVSAAVLGIPDAHKIQCGSTTGLTIGTATTQKIGFLNKAPAAQQTGGAATATIAYTATEQGMLQKAYDCLRTFGFLS